MCSYGRDLQWSSFVLPHGWGKKILVKYSSPNFTCDAVDNYNTTKRENVIGLGIEQDSISRNEELCFFWRHVGGLGVLHRCKK